MYFLFSDWKEQKYGKEANSKVAVLSITKGEIQPTMDQFYSFRVIRNNQKLLFLIKTLKKESLNWQVKKVKVRKRIFSEKFQMAFDRLPHFRKIISQFFWKALLKPCIEVQISHLNFSENSSVLVPSLVPFPLQGANLTQIVHVMPNQR